jgi:LysM repeat protein
LFIIKSINQPKSLYIRITGSKMMEEKKTSGTSGTQNRKKQQNPQVGLFQVKKFFSDVASAVAKEAHAIQEDHQRHWQKSQQQQQQRQQQQSQVENQKQQHQQQKQQPKKEDMKPLVEEKRTLLPPPSPSQANAQTSPVVEMPKNVISPPAANLTRGAYPHEETDWEILSEAEDRASQGGSSSFSPSVSTGGGGGVFVPRAGSVRSITSVDDRENSSHTTLSVPFKIQRTNSSSTLDSQDHTFLGPSGKGVLGVDYVEHVVLPTDTLQGICIAYKVGASQLRRANHFSGTLHSAPKKLVIPLSKQALRTGFIRVQDTDTKEYKLHSFLAEYPGMNHTEAKAYLELADWELKAALQSAKEDREWENGSDVGSGGGDDDDNVVGMSHDDDTDPKREKNEIKKKRSGRGITLKSGQIGIRVGFNSAGIPVLKTMKGTGAPKKESTSIYESDLAASDSSQRTQKVKVHSHLPAIATKSVLPEDLVNAAPQHNAFGFELQELSKRREDGYTSFSSSSS